MNTFKLLLSSAFILLICAEASAQMDRRFARRQYENPNPKKQKEEKVDYIAFAVTKLKTELDLDSFQEAVVKKIIVENQERLQKINMQDIPQDAKMDQLNQVNEEVKNSIRELLTPAQIVKFDDLGKKKKKK